ncbi:unnamed protein product [Cylindrotheca closterium]|uniref:Methyltransferase FkbM domain-containing protein n=1 Tax=Cylindrotheca closterium TaxID=2856 RepID=A0AAD2CUA5_9STRA|nr:unnamed protein product [Cylindrotheca closterium]
MIRNVSSIAQRLLEHSGVGKRKQKVGKRRLSYSFIVAPVFFLVCWIIHEHNQDEYLAVFVPQHIQIPSDELRAEISGWNARGLQLYKDQRIWLAMQDHIDIRIPPLGKVTVNQESMIKRFWNKIDGHLDWEANTFAFFQKYVTNETIVIDFGSWIGPTVLYHSQLSRRSYGIEADPVAYATLEANVRLNPQLPITIVPACVSTPEDAGLMRMKGNPGDSMSGITDKLAAHASMGWKVQCYDLPTLLDEWNINVESQAVLIKVDVESYECKLIPSIYDWLRGKKRLPILYISFHPQINDCSNDEWDSVLKVFRLYKRVSSHGGMEELPLKNYATFEDFQKSFQRTRDSSVFLLQGKR